MTDSRANKYVVVHILHAPSPDAPAGGEEDASATYAHRASTILQSHQRGHPLVRIGHVGRLSVDDGPLWVVNQGRGGYGNGNGDEQLAASPQEVTTVFLFVLSCSADGSIDRSVRKVARKLPSSSDGSNDGPAARGTESVRKFAVALLGHARCENSAQQMGDTIYTAGRRFEKALLKCALFSPPSPTIAKRLETQAELRSPEDEFDLWVSSICQ
uniref:Uncharacterized protein n=1 Tax=Odontella aurita TaxID=265563 RepID=A0A7S4K9M1_9STRA|mmetsp:Transcript_7309/g.21592  ORF Transcript_7309/g.21592 Transcript_7309/m.21592 type:complete len:214 (+) Transcript_7309:95-736(+)